MNETLKKESATKQKGCDECLSPTDILMAEYRYAQETAAQAMDDRHKVVNYFLLIVGVLLNAVAILLGGEVKSSALTVENLDYAISAVLFTLFIIGVLYLLKLVRLRQAWRDSMHVLNDIKQYYHNKLENHNLIPDAFRWNRESFQKNIKLNGCKTLFFYSAFLIMLIDSLALGGSIFFIEDNWYFICSFLLASMVIQFFMYRTQLKDKNEG